MTDKDGKEFRCYCNRCNAELFEIRRCTKCGDVEYRVVYQSKPEPQP